MISRLAGWLGRLSLNQLLALVVLASTAPFIVASLLMFNRLVADERKAIRTDLMVNAKTLAALVDNEIETHAAIAATLAHAPPLKSDDLQSFYAEASAAMAFVPGAWLALPEPDPDLTRHKDRFELRSQEIPSLARIPPGCAFNPRCPWIVPGICDVVRPELAATESASSAACHVIAQTPEHEQAKAGAQA